MCTDEARSGFAFARASADASAIEPLLRMAELADLVECGPCTTTGRTCPAWLDDLHADSTAYYGESAVEVPADAGPPCEPDASAGMATDAGEATPPASSSCSVGRAQQREPRAAAALVLVTILARRSWTRLKARRGSRSADR